ncbi:MAG: GNAT family N-acetyltransferase [Saprospirales bacterium]|nr:GNAT family N-acetyltransferase [Saprospirales bacterium]
MEISYKIMGPVDLEEYRRARLDCLLEYSGNFAASYEEEVKKGSLLFDEYIRAGDRDNFVLGAFFKQSCIGICGHLREPRERTRHVGKLVQVYVAKPFQRQGIGRELMRRMMEIAFKELEMEQLILGVVSNNEQASNLYEKLGFEEYGMMKKFLKFEGAYYDQRLMVKFAYAE